jgi:putative redox protein
MHVVATVVDPRRRRVEARTDDAHPIVMDADPPDGDGSGAGPREALLAALAACTSMDVVSILGKKRQAASSYTLEVTGETADEHPKIFTNIVVTHRIAGDVDAEALRRSIELSATRYCPISAMLAATSRVEHRYLLDRQDGPPLEASVAVLGPGSDRAA